MIAVADGEKDRIVRPQRGEIVHRGAHAAFVVDRPAAQMAAAQHQFEIIERLQLAAARVKRLDERALRIVGQQHQVRKLECRAVSHAHARGQTRLDRSFRRADERPRAGRIIVSGEINEHHQSQPPAGLRGALGQHELAARGREHAGFKISAHGAVNGGGGIFIRPLQKARFRVDQAQRRGRVADERFRLVPIFGLRGELIACHDGPFCQIDARAGQKKVGNADAIRHFQRPPASGRKGVPAPAGSRR